MPIKRKNIGIAGIVIVSVLSGAVGMKALEKLTNNEPSKIVQSQTHERTPRVPVNKGYVPIYPINQPHQRTPRVPVNKGYVPIYPINQPHQRTPSVPVNKKYVPIFPQAQQKIVPVEPVELNYSTLKREDGSSYGVHYLKPGVYELQVDDGKTCAQIGRFKTNDGKLMILELPTDNKVEGSELLELPALNFVKRKETHPTVEFQRINKVDQENFAK